MPQSTPTAEIIQKLYSQQEAWNQSDAVRYSQDCDENISFTNVRGEIFHGRQAFEEKHTQIFASFFKGSTIEMKVSHIHFPTPEVAIVDIDVALKGYTALPPGVHALADGTLLTRLLEVFVLLDAGWRIVAYHNVDVKFQSVGS